MEAQGVPIALTIDSANPHEVKLVEPTLEARLVEDKPEHLIGDNAYDSDGLDATLTRAAWRGLHPLALTARTGPKDGRPLRRYRRRWQVERFFAWLQPFRWVITCWKVKAENYLDFVHLACVLILLWQLL